MAEQADIDRLVRLLGMTGSDSDGEALTAIRMAGKLLAELKLTWADVIAQPVKRTASEPIYRAYYPEQPSPPPARPDAFSVHAAADQVRTSRIRLDFVLARRRLDSAQLAHFEAIRKHHQQTGYIGPAHRAQIDRQFFKAGWDSPLAPEAGEKKIEADERELIEDYDDEG